MSPSPDFDLQSWHASVLGRLARAYHAATNGFAQFTDMPSTRWRLLYLVHSKEGCTQKELTRQIGVDGGAITRQLKSLEQDGLVTRHAHPADNRLTVVQLTATGLAEIERVLTRRRVFLAEMMRGCSAAEIDTFLTVLDRIAENLHQPDVMQVLAQRQDQA